MARLSQTAAVARLRRLGAADMVAGLFGQGYAASTISAKLRQAYPGATPSVRAAIFKEGRREWDASVSFGGLNQFAHAWQTPFRRRDQPDQYQYIAVVQIAAGPHTGERRLVKVSSSVELRKWELV